MNSAGAGTSHRERMSRAVAHDAVLRRALRGPRATRAARHRREAARRRDRPASPSSRHSPTAPARGSAFSTEISIVVLPMRHVIEKPGHAGRDARRDRERRSAPPEPEDVLEPEPVEPRGRARVPGPSAAPDVERMRVDVGGDDVGLDLVALDVLGRPRAVDRVQHVEQLDRLVAVAELGDRHRGPDGGMSVLASVLADARDVALDVARIRRRTRRTAGRGAGSRAPAAG